jgi:hypothetical protein
MRISCAKTSFGWRTTFTSTGLGLGFGFGVGVGFGVGDALSPGFGVAGVGVGGSVSGGGSVTFTVATVGRSGTGPAMNRSTRLTTRSHIAPAPNVFVATATAVSVLPTRAIPPALPGNVAGGWARGSIDTRAAGS